MKQLIWLTIAIVGGMAAILGSLMLLGSLLLWLVPLPQPAKLGQRLTLAIVALGLTLIGFGLLLKVPFPTASSAQIFCQSTWERMGNADRTKCDAGISVVAGLDFYASLSRNFQRSLPPSSRSPSRASLAERARI